MPKGPISKSTQTRNSIMHGAKIAIGEKGLDATTIKDISDASGIGRTTIYKYFPSIDGIIKQLSRELVKEMVDEAKPYYQLSNSPVERLITIYACFLKKAMSDRPWARLFLRLTAEQGEAVKLTYSYATADIASALYRGDFSGLEKSDFRAFSLLAMSSVTGVIQSIALDEGDMKTAQKIIVLILAAGGVSRQDARRLTKNVFSQHNLIFVDD